jgi:dTDP-4-dehydrorhamnose reductase
MRQNGEARVVADQIGAPTAAPSIAHVIWALTARPDLHGVYHWTDAGVASWYDFAVAIAEEAVRLRYLDREIAIHPITTEEYPTAARRPRFSLLDARATLAALGVKQRHWSIWLRRVLADMQHA